MKVLDLINLKPQIEKLAEKEMDVESAVIAAKFMREMVIIINKFEQERITLVKKFGEVKEDGSMEVIDDAKKVKFQKAVEKLLNEEADIKKIDAIMMGFKTTPMEVINILPIFV
jgi:hypothetical protein